MPTYISLIKYTHQGISTIKKAPGSSRLCPDVAADRFPVTAGDFAPRSAQPPAHGTDRLGGAPLTGRPVRGHHLVERTTWDAEHTRWRPAEAQLNAARPPPRAGPGYGCGCSGVGT